MGSMTLLSLPVDILVLLPDYLHNVEDYMNTASTCRTLRQCMGNASPQTILRLATAQTKIFFRPSPYLLVTATARELGNWARQSQANEDEFATRMKHGIDGLMEFALEKGCGLTMERIRDLHQKRFSIINPITDLVDTCVGNQWYATPNFWNGGVDDAYTIDAEPSETIFHLAIYGEVFGPDFDTILAQDTTTRRLSVDTRLEFIKYCVPDWATGNEHVYLPDGRPDPRRAVEAIGPYAKDHVHTRDDHQNNIALTWVLRSTRWRPHWQRIRAQAGPDFQEDFDDGWWYVEDDEDEQDWRQRMWEAVMVCQGLEGLGMIRPGMQDQWVDRIKSWRERIARLEREPDTTRVGRQATLEYPFLLGDLRICVSGYVGGT